MAGVRTKRPYARPAIAHAAFPRSCSGARLAVQHFHRSRRLSRYEMANGRTARQGKSHVDALCDAQSTLKVHAKVANSTVDLGETEQPLHGAEVSGLSIDLRCLCPAERVRAVSVWLQSNRRYPATDKPSVLARRDMWSVMKEAWKHRSARNHLRRIDPGQNGFTRIFRQFELNGRLVLLWITETRSRTRSPFTRSFTASLTRSQPRSLLSMATLSNVRSR